MTDCFLYPGAATPTDITTSDPTVLRSGGGAVDATIAVSGVSCLAAIGLAVVIGTATIAAAGVSAASAIGTGTHTGTAVVAPSGVSAATAIGTVTKSGGAVVAPSGVSSTSAIGTVTKTGTAVVATTGVRAISAIGVPSLSGSATKTITGVSATVAMGTATAEGYTVRWFVDLVTAQSHAVDLRTVTDPQAVLDPLLSVTIDTTTRRTFLVPVDTIIPITAAVHEA
jgi:hypothetical protein